MHSINRHVILADEDGCKVGAKGTDAEEDKEGECVNVRIFVRSNSEGEGLA